MRAKRIAAAAACLAAFVAGSSIGLPDAAAGASLTVTPSTGLVELDTVSVQGSGFSGTVGMCQAVPPVTGTGSCGGDLQLDDGDFSISYTVRRFIYVSALDRIVDCLLEGCVMAAAEASNIAGTLQTVPLGFAPPPPPPIGRGAITVDPGTDLVTGQSLTVHGTGFRANATVEVAQCASGDPDPPQCDPDVYVVASTNQFGALDTRIAVRRVIFGDNAFSEIDCAVAGACAIGAFEIRDVVGSFASAALTFRAPVSEAVLTVTPDHGLADGQTVSVSGEEFDPLAFTEISQCGPAIGDAPTFGQVFHHCETDFSLSPPVDDTGRLQATPFTVQQQISTFVGKVDCRTAACRVVVHQFVPTGDGYLTGVAPISFGSAGTGAKFFAVAGNNRLVVFSESDPEHPTSNRPLTGLAAGEKVVGLDVRPATGQLFAVGSTSRLYRIDRGAARAIAVGPRFTPRLEGGGFGVDFNPVTDRLRVVSRSGQNLRLHPDTGAVTAVDADLRYRIGDANEGVDPSMAGAAYTNNRPGATATTLFDLDVGADLLVRQDPANGGALRTVGPLGVNPGELVGFDVARRGVAFAAFTTATSPARLFKVDLTSGRARRVGTIGVEGAIRGLAAAAP